MAVLMNTVPVFILLTNIISHISSAQREYVLELLSLNLKKTWSECNTLCGQLYGTELATIISQEDKDSVVSYAQSAGQYLWIGLTDQESEGNWKWMDGTPCTIANGDCSEFWTNAPNNVGDVLENNNADCGYWDTNYTTLGEESCINTNIHNGGYLCNANACNIVIDGASECTITSNCASNQRCNDRSNTGTLIPLIGSTQCAAYCTCYCLDFPTTEPTSNPSEFPSSAPTRNPSSNPSIHPTKNPTKVPTTNPTKLPTTSVPTTSVPSTSAPTKYPSTSPIKSPTNLPTTSPTFAEQEQEQRETTIYSTGDDYESNIAANQKGSNSGLYIAVIIIVVCFVFGVAALFFYKFWKKKQRNIAMMIKDRVSSTSNVEIVNVKSSGDDDVVIADINETYLDIMDNSGDNNDTNLVEIVNTTDMGMISMSNDDGVAVDNDVLELEMVNSTSFGIMDNLYGVNVVENDGVYIDEFIIGDCTETQTIGNEAGSMPQQEENNCFEGIDYDINEDGAKEINVWLDSIGLLRYYDIFIQNGFDSLEMIQEINDENDLNRINITLVAHQMKIINHIKKLRH